MKITIQPATGEVSFDNIDPANQREVEQVMAQAIAIVMASNGNGYKAPALLTEPDDDDGELSGEELLMPAPANTVQTRRTEEYDDVIAELNTKQRQTWLYFRRNDRARGVALVSFAERFDLSSTTASARAAKLARMGFLVRVCRGYYRAIIPHNT